MMSLSEIEIDLNNPDDLNFEKIKDLKNWFLSEDENLSPVQLVEKGWMKKNKP